MAAPIAGEAVVLETRVELEPGRRTAGQVRLWLYSPEGRRSVLESVSTPEPGLYRASPVLSTPGIWEWRFEADDGAGGRRILDHGRIRVRASGWSR